MPKMPFTTQDELIESARNHFSADFTNPSRADCPLAGTFERIEEAEALPENVLLTHLFRCSECFNEFQEAMNNRRLQVEPARISWRQQLLAAIVRPRMPLLVIALPLILTGGGILIWQMISTSSRSVSDRNGSQPAAVAPNALPQGLAIEAPVDTDSDSIGAESYNVKYC